MSLNYKYNELEARWPLLSPLYVENNGYESL